jgi:hypothetical protein
MRPAPLQTAKKEGAHLAGNPQVKGIQAALSKSLAEHKVI